ncbi:MAG: TetR/AcrR family transcriptional regulator [Caulobacteraceae bacterium]
MARTQAPDYEDRRQAIIEKAAELYAERGFLGASLADLADACDTSKSLIYHYFPSKEDILFEVMQSHIRSLVEAMEAVAGGAGAAPEKLRALTRAFMHLYLGAGARQKVLLNDLSRLPEANRALIVREQRSLVDFVARLLGDMNPGMDANARRAAAMLYFGVINWTHTWYHPDGPITPDEVADMATAMALKGLGERG